MRIISLIHTSATSKMGCLLSQVPFRTCLLQIMFSRAKTAPYKPCAEVSVCLTKRMDEFETYAEDTEDYKDDIFPIMVFFSVRHGKLVSSQRVVLITSLSDLLIQGSRCQMDSML